MQNYQKNQWRPGQDAAYAGPIEDLRNGGIFIVLFLFIASMIFMST
jgi:hypothetical protein